MFNVLKKVVFMLIISSTGFLLCMNPSTLGEFPAVDIFTQSDCPFLSARAARWVQYINDHAEQELIFALEDDAQAFENVVMAYDNIQNVQQGLGVNYNPLRLEFQLNLVCDLDVVQALVYLLQKPCYTIIRKQIVGDLLIAAVFEDKKRVIELLIHHEVNLDHVAELTKQTALMYAVQALKKHLVIYLLGQGAKVNKISELNQTALDIAYENNCQVDCKDIIMLLKQYGACTAAELHTYSDNKN